MAGYTLSSGSGIRPYRSPWGAFPTGQYPLSSGVSSAACYLGRLITLDTDIHQVKASTAKDADQIVGVAAETNSTGSSGTNLLVWESNPMVEFTVASSGTLATSHVGAFRVLQWDSTLNIHYVGLDATTLAATRIVITGYPDEYAVGDTNARVNFRFLPGIPANSTVNSSVTYLAFYAR